MLHLNPQLVDDTYHAILGEGPVWYDGHLLWVDILGNKVLRYTPGTGQEEHFDCDDMVGTVVQDANGAIIAAVLDRIVRIDPASKTQTVICEVESELAHTRLNDGKCDPQGRLWVGTLDLPETAASGSLYRVDADATVSKLYEGVTVSNGLVWLDDTFYYIDSPRRTVMAFDYDAAAGTIANERVAIDFEALGVKGYPDGMTLDSDGNLWVCRWAGFGVTCFDPKTTTILHELELPVANVTACAFGGPDLQDLYITTASKGLSDEEKAAQPLAGRLFHCRPGATGLPAPVFAG